MSLNDFEHLEENILDIIIEYFSLIFPSSESKKGIMQICSILEQLSERKDWYTKKSLADASELAKSVGDERFTELINNLLKN